MDTYKHETGLTELNIKTMLLALKIKSVLNPYNLTIQA